MFNKISKISINNKSYTGVLMSLILVIILFSIFDIHFFNIFNIISIFNYAAEIGIVVNGLSLLMIAGEIDLSLGILQGFSGVLLSIFLVKYNLNFIVSLVITFLFLVIIGILKYVFISIGKIQSFITTISITFIISGTNILLSKYYFGNITTYGLNNIASLNKYRWLFVHNINIFGGYLSTIVLYWVFQSFILYIFLHKSVFGNHLYGVGGSREISYRSGIKVNKMLLVLYIISSLIAGFIGIIDTLREYSIQASSGFGTETIYVLICIMSGCALNGGAGTLIGLVCGALIYGLTYQGIIYFGLDSDSYYLYLGLILFLSLLSQKILNYIFKLIRRD